MTRPRIDLRSPGPLANTLLNEPVDIYIYINICKSILSLKFKFRNAAAFISNDTTSLGESMNETILPTTMGI